MTMPPPQPPQGPYGPPNPYAQQPPYPYPPQQPGPGAGFPQQQPWGQPVQGGWGGRPMGPPPKKDRRGVIITVVVGVLALGYIGLRAVQEVATGGSSSSPFPAAEYKLTVQPALVDGKYKLAEDLSKTAGAGVKDTYSPDIRGQQPAVAQYTSGSGLDTSVLVVSGMYGQLRTPDQERSKMLKGADDAEGSTVVVPEREITPAGSEVTLSCAVLTSDQNGAKSTVPMCSWADGNTAASVAVVTPASAAQDPESVDLEELARTTVRVRSEMRQPIG